MTSRAGSLLLTVLLAGLPAIVASGQARDEECNARELIPEQVRPMSCEFAVAILVGLARSPAFREEVDRIGRLNGIVYVKPGRVIRPPNHSLSGALSHRIVHAGQRRLLFVIVSPDLGDRAVTTIAHELEHAIEVLESNAATEADVDALFDRIGTPVRAWTTETQAAIEAERSVARDLAGRPGGAPTRLRE